MAFSPTETGHPITRRGYLLLKAMMEGATYAAAHRAVGAIEAEHPEWDFDQKRTWSAWEDHDG